MEIKDSIEIKIDSIKDEFINRTILVLALTFIPLTILTISRVPYAGVTLLVVIEPVLSLLFILTYLFRKKISMGIKVSLVIGTFLLLGLSVFKSLGLLSMGVSIFLSVIVMASLYLERKYVYSVLVIEILAYSFYGYLWSSGKLFITPDPSPFIYSISNWVTQFAGMIILLLIAAISITSMMIALKKAVRSEAESSSKVEEFLKRENERLDQLVQERTRELETTTRELMKKEQLASLGELVSGVAHEINTPLGVAVTASTFLKDINNKAQEEISRGTFSKKAFIEFLDQLDETCEMINRNLFTASTLVRNFKQISVSQTSPLKGRFNLKELVDNIIFTLRHEYKNTIHQISVEMDKEIWMVSFSNALTQILTNLLMNSLTHAFGDGREGKILIRGEKREEEAVLYFSDNGTGIPEEIQSKIYDPFFTTNRGGGGSGLGMSIVYNIVTDMLHGRIECRSSEKDGTLFTITVPLVHEEKESRV